MKFAAVLLCLVLLTGCGVSTTPMASSLPASTTTASSSPTTSLPPDPVTTSPSASVTTSLPAGSTTASSAAVPSSPVDPDKIPPHQYRPGGARFKPAWDTFYSASHEPDIDDPLIAAGKDMTSAICEAVLHQDMQFRRYAIGALGFIGDPRALPTLDQILEDASVIDYVRGDALKAIYGIDRDEGHRRAQTYANDTTALGDVARAVEKDEPWLTAPTVEE